MNHSRLAVLDGLRGIAVLLVLWYHVWEISWLPAPLAALQFLPETGFVGVHLFFFISGFVIVYPFVRAQFGGHAAPTWAHFYYRRVMKIVPSYVLSIAFVFAVGYVQTKFGSTGEMLRSLAAHLLFVHTWWPQTYGNINGVLWTLAVEVQFYAIFPLLWFAFRRRPLVTALIMTVAALAWRSQAQRCCGDHLLNAIDNLPGYLDIFAAGMLCAYAYVAVKPSLVRRWVAPVAVLACIAGFACLALLLENLWSTRTVDQWSTVWQIVNRTWIGFAFAAIALGALFAGRLSSAVIANPLLLFLGVISYNLYLFHQVIARLMVTWHIPPYATADPHNDPHWQLTFTAMAFALTIAQAALVTYAFERPLLRLRPGWWRRSVSAAPSDGALSGM